MSNFDKLQMLTNLVFIEKGMTKPGFLRLGRAKEEHKVATPCFEPIPTLACSTNDRTVCELGDTPPKHPIHCHISPPKAQNSPKLTQSVSRVVFYTVIDPTTIIEKIFLPPLFPPPPPRALGWPFPSVSHNKKCTCTWLTLVSQSLVKFKKKSGWVTVTKKKIFTSDVRMYTLEVEQG